jgi:hypothetical protein
MVLPGVSDRIVDEDIALGSGDELGKAVEKRSLPTACRPHDAEKLSLAY